MGTKPPDPGHGSAQEAESHQGASAEEDEYLQVMPALMSPLSAGLSQLSFILDGQSTWGSKIPPEQHSVLFCDVTKASGTSELIFFERRDKMRK